MLVTAAHDSTIATCQAGVGYIGGQKHKLHMWQLYAHSWQYTYKLRSQTSVFDTVT